MVQIVIKPDTNERHYTACVYSSDEEDNLILMSVFMDIELSKPFFQVVISQEQFRHEFRECDSRTLESTLKGKPIRCIKITPGELIAEVRVKPVEGFDDRFLVTDDGRVLSKATNKVIKQHTNFRGYKVFATYIGGRKGIAVCPRVHRLVAKAFIPNPENKPQINHIDGNKVNNRWTNLEWNTNLENSHHAIRTGLTKVDYGENSRLAKLTNTQVKEIRAKIARGMPMVKLIKEYGLAKSTMYDIKNNITYKDI